MVYTKLENPKTGEEYISLVQHFEPVGSLQEDDDPDNEWGVVYVTDGNKTSMIIGALGESRVVEINVPYAALQELFCSAMRQGTLLDLTQEKQERYRQTWSGSAFVPRGIT